MQYSLWDDFLNTFIFIEEITTDQVLNVYQCGGSLISNSVVLTGESSWYFSRSFKTIEFF
jgi:hypothetical protein